MKKSLLFLSLVSVFFFATPETSFAKRKYRYIKREHGVRFQGHIPAKLSASGQDISISLGGAYTYNWKGRFEFGPYGSFSSSFGSGFSIDDYSGGLLAEYNFVKNRGKVKFVPAVGLKIFGVQGGNYGLELTSGLQASIKYFVAKRTPFIFTVGYLAALPPTFDFGSLSHNIDVSMGFAYYFDFY